ncbi:MAG TPA: hypothetical protein VK203_24355 [Nostocaceae cyanobacterium]|nr:hypothetical protein [Nostocaceae cyanobacterium]
MAKAQIVITKFFWKSDFYFPITLWVVSRILIGIAMLLIAPNIPTPTDGVTPQFGWGIFDAWDSVHYRSIATTGYEFIDDGKQHNLAFFPLFPLSIWALMSLGLPFEIAGTLINNLAFLAALCCLYTWLKKHCGIITAQWATVVLSWCPMSMFTGVIYTEGMYLFFSTATLKAFDQKQYGWTAFWGAMATATRPTGMALVPALALASFKERRPLIAYMASLAAAIGLLLFSLYCAIHFDNPLAFIAAQKGWRPSLGFDWQGWLNMLLQIPLGYNWQFGWNLDADGTIKDSLHPLIFIFLVASFYILWNFHKHLSSTKLLHSLYAVVLLLLLLADEHWINNILNTLMVVGGSYLLWCFRHKFTAVTILYGFCGIGLLLASGGTISLSRIAYGIVPLSVAIGAWLSQNPRQGYLTLGIFATLLVKLAVGFAQKLWVG